VPQQQRQRGVAVQPPPPSYIRTQADLLLVLLLLTFQRFAVPAKVIEHLEATSANTIWY
jgi:hypothetical protein